MSAILPFPSRLCPILGLSHANTHLPNTFKQARQQCICSNHRIIDDRIEKYDATVVVFSK